MSDLPVELHVERNDAGRFSLIERAPGARGERHLPGDLFANPDAATFYRATALWLVEWANRGVPIDYRDWDGEVEY